MRAATGGLALTVLTTFVLILSSASGGQAQRTHPSAGSAPSRAGAVVPTSATVAVLRLALDGGTKSAGDPLHRLRSSGRAPVRVLVVTRDGGAAPAYAGGAEGGRLACRPTATGRTRHAPRFGSLTPGPTTRTARKDVTSPLVQTSAWTAAPQDRPWTTATTSSSGVCTDRRPSTRSRSTAACRCAGSGAAMVPSARGRGPYSVSSGTACAALVTARR